MIDLFTGMLDGEREEIQNVISRCPFGDEIFHMRDERLYISIRVGFQIGRAPKIDAALAFLSDV